MDRDLLVFLGVAFVAIVGFFAKRGAPNYRDEARDAREEIKDTETEAARARHEARVGDLNDSLDASRAGPIRSRIDSILAAGRRLRGDKKH